MDDQFKINGTNPIKNKIIFIVRMTNIYRVTIHHQNFQLKIQFIKLSLKQQKMIHERTDLNLSSSFSQNTHISTNLPSEIKNVFSLFALNEATNITKYNQFESNKNVCIIKISPELLFTFVCVCRSGSSFVYTPNIFIHRKESCRCVRFVFLLFRIIKLLRFYTSFLVSTIKHKMSINISH